MKAIIIAAGSGNRLGEFGKKLPKSLLDINGKTILERQVSIFRKNDLKDIVVVTGYNKEKFNFKKNIYIYDSDYIHHEILGSLMVARDYIKDEVLIIYSDILFEETILQQVLKSKSDIGIAVDLEWEKSYVDRTDNPKSEAENVLLDNTGSLLQIKKNIQSADGKVGEFLGIIKLSSKGSEIFVNKFDALKNSHTGKFHSAPSLQRAYLTDMIQELVDSKVVVTPILISGKWYEIDTIQDLEKVRMLFP